LAKKDARCAAKKPSCDRHLSPTPPCDYRARFYWAGRLGLGEKKKKFCIGARSSQKRGENKPSGGADALTRREGVTAEFKKKREKGDKTSPPPRGPYAETRSTPAEEKTRKKR